jgi:hypothetical protein
MPIINKGIFDTGDAFLRQTGNDWPTAQVISTADVIESSSNLYFTNARVVSALIAGQNIIIEANGRISSTSGAGDLTTADVRETSNLYYTNTRVVTAVTPLLTTANVIETSGNLYFTDARAVTTVTPLLTTANVIETSGNLYFTDARAVTTVTPLLTTANVIETSANLYFTNTRVFDALTIGTISGSIAITGNLVANGLIIRNIDVSDNVLAGNITAGASVSNTIVADSITSNIWNGLYTANVIETNTNLYFTNARSRSAFTAGRGIIIMNDGTIKSTIGTETFNTAIDGGRDYKVTSAMGGLTFTSAVAGDRFLLRSLHVTNISDNTAYISSNVLYAGGNTAYMGNLIPVPVGSVVEFMDRPQIMQPGDTVNLQGFDQSLTPTGNILHSYFTFESINNDTTYVGVGQNLAQSNTNIQIVVADQSDTIFESIKFVNLQSYSIPVKLYFGSANGAPRSYLAYNMQVPPNSSMEMLQSPKLLKYLDVVYASYSNASAGDSIAVFSSYRRTAVTSTFGTTSSAVALGNIQASFLTTIPDGTTLYYTLE